MGVPLIQKFSFSKKLEVHVDSFSLINKISHHHHMYISHCSILFKILVGSKYVMLAATLRSKKVFGEVLLQIA